jgi:hypothetical protein
VRRRQANRGGPQALTARSASTSTSSAAQALRHEADLIGRGYVMSVRHGAWTSYTPVRERYEASPKAFSDGDHFIQASGSITLPEES